MQSHLIYWPVLAQILIPILVLLTNGARKKNDVKAGTVDLEKAAMDNEAWSRPVVLTSKNLANQFQVPVLFYVVCLILAMIDGVTNVSLFFAWAFVLSRYIHAYVHITNNYVPARLNAFIFGVFMLIALWVLAVMALARI